MVADTQSVVFNFDRVYIKDASFESPRCPEVFADSNYEPKVDVQLQISHQCLDTEVGQYEVIINVTITATSNKKTAFLVELQQAGVFTIRGFEPKQHERALEAAAPNALFPFLRENINRFVTEGGFPSLLLQPVNFEAMYEQKQNSETDSLGDNIVSH
ncbi:MAG: protein-export chaperone SecB [Acidiferrobacteraceae bacterium]|nr:protein-export chaperone SecB [Acidiferrobacteraceae bacterium]|tara:strand:+ start:9014 stop:9487 length:474 start_codon:yes stop_codon:yes gene_type:complete